MNAKIKRPSVCNAVETLLIHGDLAVDFLPDLARQLSSAGVQLMVCAIAREIVSQITEATEEDWADEYLDLILAVRIVNNADEAVDHISRYSTVHSDAIVTE